MRQNAELTQAEFLALVRRLSATALIERFSLDHSSWRDMKGRQNGGCIVAPEFLNFRSFLRHMGMPRPGPNYTLDRINTFRKEYGPGLCRWAPRSVQDTNRTDTIRLTGSDGRTLPLTTWATITDQDPKTLRQRRSRHPDWTDLQIIHGEAGAAPSGPEISPGPVVAPTRPLMPGSGSWPADMNPKFHAAWESAYQTYLPLFPAPRARLTRSVFFVWLMGASFERLCRILKERHQGLWDEFTAQDELEWDTISVDPDYATHQRLSGLLRQARAEIWAIDPREELVKSLRTRFPGDYGLDPARLGKLRWRRMEEA